VWKDGEDGKSGMDAVRKVQVDLARHGALAWMIGGLVAVFVGGIAIAIASVDLLEKLQLVVAALEFVIDGVGVLASWDPESAPTFYSLLSGASGLLTMVNAVLATLNGMATWMLWTMRAVVDVGMMTAGQFGTLLTKVLVTAFGSLLQTGGQLAYTVGAQKMVDVAQQSNMPIWDWCDGPGKGKCETEPNGGMPEAA